MNTNIIESTFATHLLDNLNFTNIKYDIELSHDVLESLEKIQEESKHVVTNSLIAIGKSLIDESNKNIETIINATKTMLDAVIMIHSVNLNLEDYKFVKQICNCADVIETLSKKYL